MKRNIKTLSIGIIVFLLPIICYSQKNFTEGYIINNKNERIEGEVEKLSNISNCQYLNFKEGEHTIKYLPNQVKSWGITGSRLFVRESILVNDFEEQVFLEYLINARVSLLVYYGVGDDPRFFVQKEGDEIRELIYTVSINDEDMEVENKQYIGVLTILFNDCPEIKDDISSVKFKMNDLIKLIKEYNICVDPSGLVFETRAKVQSPVTFGIVVGYCIPSYSSFSTDDDKDHDITSAEDISKGFLTYGINVEGSVSKIEGLSFGIGVLYSQSEVEFDRESGDNIFFSNKSITFPIQLKYAYSRYKLKPFAGIGYTSVFHIKHTGFFVNHHKGLNACIGVDYQVFDFASVYFEFRYQYVRGKGYDPPGKDYPPYDWLKLNSKTMNFLIGINF